MKIFVELTRMAKSKDFNGTLDTQITAPQKTLKWNHACRCLPREWKTFSYFCFVWVFGSKRNQYAHVVNWSFEIDPYPLIVPKFKELYLSDHFHYILGISIFTIFWSLKVHVTLTKTRKWSKTRMKAIYCAFESWYIIFLIYEILGTIWVPYYGCIEVWKEENCDKLRFLRCHFDEIYGSAWYPNGTQNFMMPKYDI